MQRGDTDRTYRWFERPMLVVIFLLWFTILPSAWADKADVEFWRTSLVCALWLAQLAFLWFVVRPYLRDRSQRRRSR